MRPGNKAVLGFTLMEVVAALALLGAGLAILYAGYGQAVRQEAKYAGAGRALTLARAKLAEVEAGAEQRQQGECIGAPGYTWQLLREAVVGSEAVRLTVTVRWRDEGEHSVSVWALSNDGS